MLVQHGLFRVMHQTLLYQPSACSVSHHELQRPQCGSIHSDRQRDKPRRRYPLPPPKLIGPAFHFHRGFHPHSPPISGPRYSHAPRRPALSLLLRPGCFHRPLSPLPQLSILYLAKSSDSPGRRYSSHGSTPVSSGQGLCEFI